MSTWNNCLTNTNGPLHEIRNFPCRFSFLFQNQNQFHEVLLVFSRNKVLFDFDSSWVTNRNTIPFHQFNWLLFRWANSHCICFDDWADRIFVMFLLFLITSTKHIKWKWHNIFDGFYDTFFKAAFHVSINLIAVAMSFIHKQTVKLFFSSSYCMGTPEHLW